MIYNLQNGDQILFIKNLLEDGTYGNNIFTQERYWLQDQQIYLIDDPTMKLFPDLKEIYWKHRNELKSKITQATVYYTYVLVNGEYRIIKIGKKICDMILEFVNP